ncbi:MAG: response regulator, partial [Gammaproteobacteria bacterium]
MSEIEQKTVLIVDDVRPNRKLLNALLSRQGFNVIESENGEQAVEMYQQHDDLYMIFMDVMMPVMDGNEATRKIKQLSGNRFIPIIMVTALDEHQGMAKGVEAGADDYLTKPIDAILLSSKLKAMQRIRDLHDLQEKQYKQLQAIQKRIDDEQRLAESILNAAIGN